MCSFLAHLMSLWELLHWHFLLFSVQFVVVAFVSLVKYIHMHITHTCTSHTHTYTHTLHTHTHTHTACRFVFCLFWFNILVLSCLVLVFISFIVYLNPKNIYCERFYIAIYHVEKKKGTHYFLPILIHPSLSTYQKKKNLYSCCNSYGINLSLCFWHNT